jgi:FAD/FMN-containing dehydrogenase
MLGVMTALTTTDHLFGSLRIRVAGAVVLPDDPGWGDARRAWNLAVDQRPAAVVVVDSVDDVIAVVEFARASGLHVAAQGTGHGACSLPSLTETILLKTSRLRGVEIDARARRARVEAGALWCDVVASAAEQGFVVLHGSSPDVGVMGYTLGGGIGWLARSHGLAANAVTAVEVVTADGRLVWADHETEPDIFWAVRGGGGSFGVVVAIEIELFETPEIYAGAMFWPAERAGTVLRAWRAWVDTVPDEVMSVGRVMHFPPLPHIPEQLRGGSFAIIEAVFTGPEAEGRALVAPLRALAPCMDTFAAVGPMALTDLHMDPPEPIPAAGDGIFVEELPRAAIDAVVETAVPPLLTLEIRHLGGVLAEPSPRHGAVGAIDADFVMFAAGPTPTAESHAAVDDAIDRAKAALGPWESARTYFNFSERPIDANRLYPAETYQRLRRIKAVYDPSELFVSNHPITPAQEPPIAAAFAREVSG